MHRYTYLLMTSKIEAHALVGRGNDLRFDTEELVFERQRKRLSERGRNPGECCPRNAPAVGRDLVSDSMQRRS